MSSRSLVCLLCLVSCTTAWTKAAFNITVQDVARNRAVTAIVCLASPSSESSAAAGLDLYVFAHGGGLFAEDYGYLCDDLQPTHAIARLGSIASDDPMDLELMAADMSFLANALPQQSKTNSSSPLFQHLSGRVVLSGHSMGGAAALLAGQVANDNVVSVGSLAPGFWGPKQAALLESLGSKHSALCEKSLLVVAGDQDCANSLSAQALFVWDNVTASCGNTSSASRALVVLRGATHCQWTTPVKGSCNFDVPCAGQQRLQRAKQQQLGSDLLNALPSDYVNQLRLMKIAGEVSYVDQDSSASDAAQLHSFCPCGKTSAAEEEVV